MRRAAPLAIFLSVLALGSGALFFTRIEPADIPAALERIYDQRTDGERAVAAAQSRLNASPNDARALVGLASAYLFRVRETADPAYYSKAEILLSRAAAVAPADPDVLITSGTLALSRHDFAGALELGQRAVSAAPFRPAAYGILTDALVQLRRDDDAVVAAQRMVDLRPDLASLSRVSYLRELRGDLPGALDAMRRARDAGAPRSEATAFAEVHVGDLLFALGDLDGAERAYESAMQRLDGYPYAIAGRARVRAARGDLSGAAALYEDASRRLPVADFVTALADVYDRMGEHTKADQQRTLLAAMKDLLAANGVRVEAATR